MADIEPIETPEPSAGLNKTWIVRAALHAGAILVVLMTLGWSGHRFWLQSQGTQADVSLSPASAPAMHAQAVPATLAEFLGTLALLFVGLAGGLLLWALAEILYKLDALQGDFRGALALLGRAPAPAVTYIPAGSTAPAAAGRGDAFQELARLMREVRDISLLTESQRIARLEIEGRELVRRLEQTVPALVREHNWTEAHRQLHEARARFPMLPQWDALERQAEAARLKIETHDVEAARRQINDLIALKAWQRAAEVMRELLERHPGSAAAKELERRLAQEREKATVEERAQLMARAQAATNQHDWAEALAIANTVVHHYPNSLEAEALRAQMPTLQANLEIQTRQRMEAEFRELYKQQRYDEALEIAREFLERYPDSPQAQALRDKIATLEQKATGTG